MKNKLNVRNRYILLGDLLFIVISAVVAYILRLELVEVFSNYYLSLLSMCGLSILIKPVIYYLMGLYRRMWIYASMRELRLIIFSVTLASAAISIIMLVLFENRFFISFPRSVLIIDWILSIILVGGLRFSLRMLAEYDKENSIDKRIGSPKKILIIGAGDAGALVANELLKYSRLEMVPLGFLDDNPDKFRQQIHGIPVIGKIKELSRTIHLKNIDEVIIAIPSAPGSIIRNITEICRKNHIPYRTMPGLFELIGGKVSVTRLREVEISDLLRRQPAQINDERIGEIIQDKSVLITGAGGSIGIELCRQIARYRPSKMIMLGHGENSIFEAYLEIKADNPDLVVNASISDIRDSNRIEMEFSRYEPQVVFHAAAHKHVPLMERNIEECILNNVLGTLNIITSCQSHNIERLVLISTDKAINPVSIMGASKRIAEMMVLDAAAQSSRPFSVVRFGNVLGSRGSVVPLFKKQIIRGGPVTVTHPEMKRYFMTIPEAVYLVLQAASMGKGGEIFILNMGEQIRILDLAKDLIRLSGLEPEKDIEIIFTGIREGEKLSEELWNNEKIFHKTEHPEILCEQGQDIFSGELLHQITSRLIVLSNKGQTDDIISLINEKIPGADVKRSPRLEISDID